MKRFLPWLVILAVLGLGGYYAANNIGSQEENMEDRNGRDKMETNELGLPASNEASDESPGEPDLSNVPDGFTTYTSPQNNLAVSYPEEWYLDETVTQNGGGPFGEIISAWILSTFELDDQGGRGGIPEGSIKIDFEISIPNEDFELENLTNCNNEEVECITVLYSDVEFTRAYEEGGQVPSIVYAGMEDGILYRATVLFGSNPSDLEFSQNKILADKVISTIQIL